MFPVLFSIGAFEFQTIWIVIVVSVLIFVFISYQKSEEEVLATGKVFDVLIISGVSGFILGKIVESFLVLGEADFSFSWRLSGINFWAAVFAGLATLAYFASKFKLPQIQVAEIAAFAAIPAFALFSFGKLLVLAVNPVNIFLLIWHLLATIVFLLSSKKAQISGFYLVLAGIFFSFGQAIVEITKPLTTVRVFNLSISVVVLTIAGILYYLRSGRKIFSNLAWLVQNLPKTLKRLKDIFSTRGKPWKRSYQN